MASTYITSQCTTYMTSFGRPGPVDSLKDEIRPFTLLCVRPTGLYAELRHPSNKTEHRIRELEDGNTLFKIVGQVLLFGIRERSTVRTCTLHPHLVAVEPDVQLENRRRVALDGNIPAKTSKLSNNA